MARIVIVLTDPPLPFGNAAARWFYVLLKGLTRRGHDVTALVSCGKPEEAARVAELFPKPDYDVRLFPHARSRNGPLGKIRTFLRPYSYLYGPELRLELERERVKGFDVLQLEHLWGGWVGLKARDRAVVNIHYLFLIDLEGVPTSTLGDRIRKFMTRRAERRLLLAYRNFTTLTPRLTERVRQIHPQAAVHTVPLGMDLDLYPFQTTKQPRDGEGPVVGLIGSFHWHPTYTAANRLITRLWPEIRRRVPQVRLQLVGRQARVAFGQLEAPPELTVVENVPDVLPYFRSTDVLLYPPTQGSGMKVKVLEAFALGVPVVTNADGVEGIAAVDGEHAGIQEDDAGLIDRTVALLNDAALRDRRRVAARALMEATVDPDVVLDRLEAVYETLPSFRAAQSRSRPSPIRP